MSLQNVTTWDIDVDATAARSDFPGMEVERESALGVVARFPGSGGGRTLLIDGHTDVVPPGDIGAWTGDPFIPRTVQRDGRDATTEMSLNYTMTWALANAMKLAGTTTDAAAIRAKMPDAVKALPKEVNPNEVDGIDAKGGSVADTVVGWVQKGKIEPVRLSELAK